MGRLFGTDGMRGIANKELTCELAMQIGRAAAMVLAQHSTTKPKVLIGMDTRASSQMLEAAISAGLCSVGADVLLLGVVPTPAVAYLVTRYSYDAGIMISASHNSFEYNGIKIFQSNGYKLPDELEEEIEAIILDKTKVLPIEIGGLVGRITSSRTARYDYTEYLKSCVKTPIRNIKAAFDCANGSASVIAPELFMSLGVDCLFISAHPNGVNINENCGSTHLSRLKDFVVRNGCDVGFAFDGDADRLLAVDEKGCEIDGDRLIAIFSSYMKSLGVLKKDTAVVTVMSNMGLFKFFEENDIKYEKTKVGDRYVLETMLEHNYNLGGEQSGHIIFSDYSKAGDGQLSAIKLLEVMSQTNKKLSALAKSMTVFPQIMINIKVSDFGKVRFPHDEEIKKAIDTATKELSEKGRVLVRVSGTEPLVRIMVEGEDTEKIKELAEEIAEVVKERLL